MYESKKYDIFFLANSKQKRILYTFYTLFFIVLFFNEYEISTKYSFSIYLYLYHVFATKSLYYNKIYYLIHFNSNKIHLNLENFYYFKSTTIISNIH